MNFLLKNRKGRKIGLQGYWTGNKFHNFNKFILFYLILTRMTGGYQKVFRPSIYQSLN